MKSNFAYLVKIEFLKFIASFNTKGKKIRQTPLFYFALLILAVALVVSVGYSFLIITPYVKAGVDPSSAVAFFAGVVSLFIFMTSLSQARTIYIGDDYDLLVTLPIKKKDIVASKILVMYAIELAFSIIIMIPHAIMMMILANNLTCCIVSIILAFTLPIVPIAIAIFLSLLITMATARFKSANFIFVIFYALFIVALSTLSMIVNNMKDASAAEAFGTIGGVLKWTNPSYIFVEMAFNNNILYIIPYAAITIVVALVSILFLALFFDKLHEIVSSISMKKTYVRKDLKTKTEGKVLLKLEFKRLINSKVYFVNSIMGSIMAVLGSVVFLVSFSQPMATASPEALPYMELLLIPMYLVIVMMIVGLANPTTGSINIEGKNFWLVKSLPTDYKAYMRTKLFFSWILTVPAVLIASIVAVIFAHYSAFEIVATFLIPLAYCIFNSLIGLVIAIRHPKLKWNSEAEAVKNSAAVLIALLVDFGVSIIFGAVLIAVPLLLPNLAWIAPTIVFAIIVIGALCSFLWLNKNFAKKIDEIEDL